MLSRKAMDCILKLITILSVYQPSLKIGDIYVELAIKMGDISDSTLKSKLSRSNKKEVDFTPKQLEAISRYFSSKFANETPYLSILINEFREECGLATIETTFDTHTWEILANMGVTNQAELVELENRLNIYSALGVSGGTTKMADPQYVSEKCLQKVDRQLWFMGVCGFKWLNGAKVRGEFGNTLTRVNAQKTVETSVSYSWSPTLKPGMTLRNAAMASYLVATMGTSKNSVETTIVLRSDYTIICQAFVCSSSTRSTWPLHVIKSKKKNTWLQSTA